MPARSAGTPFTHMQQKVEPLMRATLMYGAGDVRVEDVPDSVIQDPTDALIRITDSCICGSDLHPYHSWHRRTARLGWVTSSSASSRTSAPTSPLSARVTW